MILTSRDINDELRNEKFSKSQVKTEEKFEVTSETDTQSHSVSRIK